MADVKNGSLASILKNSSIASNILMFSYVILPVLQTLRKVLYIICVKRNKSE